MDDIGILDRHMTDRQTDRQTYAQVISYLSTAIHSTGQTIILFHDGFA